MDFSTDIDPHAPQRRAAPHLAGSPLALFFRRVRRRLQRRALLRHLLIWLSASLLSLALLMSAASVIGPSSAWLPLSLVWIASVLGSAGVLFHRTWRLPPSDHEIARYVGGLVPDLQSDLLSVVELQQSPPVGCSTDLVTELAQRTAAAAATLDLTRLVAWRPLLRLGLIAGGVVLLFLVRLGAMAHGARLLFQSPPPNPVAVSTGPLLGDLRLLLNYPRYTALPPRVVPSSSGDITVLPGTEVRIEARVLIPVERAQALLQLEGKQQTVPVQIVRPPPRVDGPHHPLLIATFTAQQSGSYHFIIERGYQDRVRERESHRIDIERDQPPRVELFAPADELEVTSVRRIELGYSAEDDLGLGDVDLVYKIGNGGERRKRVRSAVEGGKKSDAARPAPVRNLAAKMEWDLSEIDLSPGTTVVYFMEARDLDTVSGPNIGRSRSYVLHVLSPREKADALLASQEQLREQAIQLLGDRIDWGRALPAAAAANPGGAATGDPREPTLDAWERLQSVHRKSEALLVQLGRIGQGPSDASSPGTKDLRSTLQEIGHRLGKLTQEEEALLGELRSRRTQGTAAAYRRALSGKEVSGLNERHVVELERDTLLIDDLIGRQRMEELLAIGDEMSSLRERMRQLIADYKRAPSEALRREIERELRAFERRLAELAERAQRLGQEVPDEFVNREALGQNDMQSRLERMRDLLQKGDIDRAAAEFEHLSQVLDGLIKGMEHGLRSYRRERFTAEEKALAELENRISDLVHDEELLKRRTEELKGHASARARQLVRDRAESLSRKLLPEVARLRKLLAEVDVAPLGPWGSDEMDKAQRRLDDLSRMLEQGDLDEARAMAEEAGQTLERIEGELRSEEQASRWGQRVRIGRSRAKAEQARNVAAEIEAEIGKALPQPEDLLSPQERRQMSDLRAEQEALRKRSGELGREFGKRGQQLKEEAPAMERLSQQAGELLRKAQGHMQQSEGELGRLAPRGAASAQGQALDQLGQLQRQVQQARRPRSDGAGSRSDREPVKIPGAEDYRAPKEFRQDILDAAKREAPVEYRDQVKQYYEELIR